MAENSFTEVVKQRASALRIRTYVMTISILVCLVLWLFVNITTKEAISWVDFVLLTIIQILVYSSYFPDGEIFGERSPVFMGNKAEYNKKANEINTDHNQGLLREYCKYDYKKRIQEYIETECGALGLTPEELDELKQYNEKEILALKEHTFIIPRKNENDKEIKRVIKFSKKKRRRIRALLFDPIPVEENYPETILSAIENNGQQKIKDHSISFKFKSFVKKVITAILFGGLLAYTGLTSRDGIGLAEITRMVIYFTTMVVNAIIAYTTGETCTKVYKNRFYVDLSNFIDGFNEWKEKEGKEI